MHLLNHKAAIIVTGCLILAVALLTPQLSKGDEWNLATRFTVNHPFEVPNMVLQPNTPYVIRLYDSPSERHVVQIYNSDQTKMLTMFMGISDERADYPDKTLFTFIETQPGYPLPMKEWFYPGRRIGLEFIYPKQQALEIARHAREPILSASSTDLHKLSSISVEAIGPVGTEVTTTTTQTATNVTNAPVAETKPAEPEIKQEQQQAELPKEEQPAEVAQNTQPEPKPEAQPEAQSEVQQPETQQEQPVQTAQNENKELPRTAGELPLVGFIGLACLAAGLSVKAVSSKS